MSKLTTLKLIDAKLPAINSASITKDNTRVKLCGNTIRPDPLLAGIDAIRGEDVERSERGRSLGPCKSEPPGPEGKAL